MFPILLFFQSWKSRACMLGSGLIKNRHYCVTNPQPRAQHTNVQSWALYYSAIQTPQRGECFHVIPRDKKNSYKLWINLSVKGVVEICQMVSKENLSLQEFIYNNRIEIKLYKNWKHILQNSCNKNKKTIEQFLWQKKKYTTLPIWYLG